MENVNTVIMPGFAPKEDPAVRLESAMKILNAEYERRQKALADTEKLKPDSVLVKYWNDSIAALRQFKDSLSLEN